MSENIFLKMPEFSQSQKSSLAKACAVGWTIQNPKIVSLLLHIAKHKKHHVWEAWTETIIQLSK